MPDTIWLVMPLGAAHGWGVCGQYLALGLKRLVRVHFITETLEPGNGMEGHFKELAGMHVPPAQIQPRQNAQGVYELDDPVLQAIEGANLAPWLINVRAPKRIGYTFFEKTTLNKNHVEQAGRYFDWIAAGSSWCEEVLKAHGMQRSSTIIQGIDPELFHPGYAQKKNFQDQFVVFSGGKIELRKGQDLVIRAFKVLQDKYDDVLLVNAWYNMWDESLMTMRFSPYIRFDMPGGDYFKAINRLLTANGIHPGKVLTLGPKPHQEMAAVYRDTDCGLFPNRCEGGTNLVLMEYMACAKPVIAAYCTGQRDILAEPHAMPLHSLKSLTLRDPSGRIVEQYDDPDLDEIIDCLDWAYHHRDEIRAIGMKAGQYMQDFTWQKAAVAFFNLLRT